MKAKACILMGVLLLLGIPLGAAAAVCPNLSDLGSITGGPDFAPSKVATDAQGNIYVTDPGDDRLMVYDYKGSVVRSLAMVGPMGVAVDADGNVYVGRSECERGFCDGEVNVYDANLNYLRSLGQGWREFQQPGAILVAGETVFVADSKVHVVKRYSAVDGSYLDGFGGYGHEPGNLVFPAGMDFYSASPALEILTTDMADGVIGAAYSYPIVADGGTKPYSFAVSAGSLPDGLTLDGATGQVTGTPTTAGTSSFTVEVTDGASATTSQTLSIAVGVLGSFGMADDFDDGIMDPKWVQFDAGFPSMEQNGRLEVSLPAAAGSRNSGYQSAGAGLDGDFDVRLSFDSLSYEGVDGYQGPWLEVTNGSDYRLFARIYRNTDGTDLLQGGIFLAGSWVSVPLVDVSGLTSGTFRLQRTGGDVSVFLDKGAGWELLNSASGFLTGAMTLQFYAKANDGKGVSVNFDNLLDFSPPGSPAVPTALGGDRLYIADHALAYTEYNGQWDWQIGAGGHIFSTDGTFIKSFVTYGVPKGVAGSMRDATGMAVDLSDRVIMPDYDKGELHVFDMDGTPICLISLGDFTLFPVGVHTGADGRLFVSQLGRVSIYGLDNYVGLSVSPGNLAYDMGQCGGGSLSQNLTITNNGPGVLDWSISSDVSWLTPATTAGSINGQASVTVAVNATAGGLGVGTHHGILTVRAQGAVEKIPVTITVAEPSNLTVTPLSLVFDVQGTTMPPAQTLAVGSDGQVLAWAASSNVGWLSVSPASGSTDTNYVDNVSINPAGLDALAGGTHAGTISITSACAANSPLAVPVTLNYVKGGTITVTTNYDGAEFTLTGPATYSGTGTSYTVDGAPEGDYTITYAHSQGLIEPDDETKAVVNGGATDFTGTYADLRENNNLVITMGSGPWTVDDEVRITGPDGTVLGSFVVTAADPLAGGARAGAATATGDVDGDGVDEIIAGHDMGVVSGYEADGSPLAGLSFRAYPFESEVVVAVGDVDGDGTDEIIVGAGDKNNDQAMVRVFSYSGSAVQDTGVNFLAYQEKKGASVTAGDVDGDGVDEIVTCRGGSSNRYVDVRVWDVDSSAGVGAWRANASALLRGPYTNRAAYMATGDLDADGTDEILVSTYDNGLGASPVTGLALDGTVVLEFTVPVVAVAPDAVRVAAGDIDFDGTAEIAVSEDEDSAAVKLYDADGTYRGEFFAFDDIPEISGARITFGQLLGQ